VISEATPNAGYTFDHWVAAPSTQDFNTTINPSSFVWDSSDGISTWNITAYFVYSVHRPPISDAGPDQTVTHDDLVHLDGSESYNPDGGSLTYKWIQTGGQNVVLSGDTDFNPTFTAPDVQSNGETLTFMLTVTNNNSLTDTDTVSIKVRGINPAIEADAGIDQAVFSGDIVTLDGSNSGGAIISYQWQQTYGPSVVLSGSNEFNPSFSTEMKPTFTAPVVSETTMLSFQLTVEDSGWQSEQDSINIIVYKAGTIPTWFKDADGDGYSDETSIQSASRPDGDYYLASELLSTSGDCNDDNPTIHPAANEIRGDGIDQDCNGSDLMLPDNDLDMDGDVDIMDIMSVAARWNTHTGDPNYDASYDLDADGDIDIMDIMMVAAQWGWTG
jgi:hypothetical protein